MRKPRDIDGELKALTERARELKSRRVLQLGELVVLTGADTLDLPTLTGALLAGVEGAKTEGTRTAWSRAGAAFFRNRGRKGAAAARAAAGEPPGAETDDGGAAAG